MSSVPRTIIDKIWDAHVVTEESGAPAVLYIDLHLVHEVTSPQAFDGLRRRKLQVHQTNRTIATIDHSIPTQGRGLEMADDMAAKQCRMLEENCSEFGVTLFGLGHHHRGIVHVIGPELGLTQPGMTIVCGDSHTATHGAFGALAFGIGTSEVEHVLGTQCLLQRKPKACAVQVDGTLKPGVSPKDIILALLAKIGVRGGTGHVFEYTGSAIRALDMEGRMTICNMSIEGGARAGLIAPDDTTFQFLKGREYAPKGEEWDKAVVNWRQLPSDPGAKFDKMVSLDASALEPMITYGTNPGMGMPISGVTPDPEQVSNATERAALTKALQYMDLPPGKPLAGKKIDVVFIGSCTNSRINDLRDAAKIFRGRKVAPHVRTLVVPGSQKVKRQAEAEGLADIFKEACDEWR